MKLLLIGAGGGLGRALLQHYLEYCDEIHAISRRSRPLSLPAQVHWHELEGELDDYQQLCLRWSEAGEKFDGVISTIGWLHQGDWQPERRIEALNQEQLQSYFNVNAIMPIMLLQAIKPLLPKKKPCFVVQLGAKVGSISDNQLGGWYGYRASKAALNMLFKTAAIEFKRTHKQLSLAVIHPGTTDSDLSEPFQQRIEPGKLYTAEQSAARIASVIEQLKPASSGGFWFWDGTALPY
ncbi:short-chain dehydrogenase [Aliidiomarina minuta]|uniref:Short-chain dehydrogenase n=1 Tax=Aliidiomarina minuta TaxID=880057 RepID=A0A432W3M1_9GAMM|nr:SDR family NAD(P)-dependent oxidoreductase [Aliidiomarina minuta]RUO23896.1 short-chain dehydrogenase [Aliidiomarina minuta]